jgi:ketosteroid isomerase-like protein
MPTNAEVLTGIFAGWGRSKPPAFVEASHPDVELVVPPSMPYRGGVFRGAERIVRWFSEDLWEMWADFSSTPTDFIDGGDKIVMPVHVKGTTHDRHEVEVDNVWIYSFEHGKVRSARLYADTATLRAAVFGER